MSSKSGARQRFPGKTESEENDNSKRGKKLTEEEAVSKASRRWIAHFLLAFTLSLVAPVIVLMFLPSPVKPKEFPHLTPPQAFEGPLAPNNHLASAEIIHQEELKGPESIVIDGEYIYTGTSDGWVNRLYQGEVKRLVQFGTEPCGGFENEVTCGRPLGLRMDKNGLLVVCDAYHGLFQVNVTTGDYETIYKATTPINGKASKFVNDLDIDDNGKIYFTDSSTEWHRNQLLNILMEGDTSGRLLMFDPKTKTTKQLVGDLIFANGVQLTPDQSIVLVAEFGRARIMKYDIKSKSLSVWADGLPGFPDNIRYDATSQTYWVGTDAPRLKDKFSIIDFFATKPWLRGMAAKVVTTSNLATLRKILAYIVTPEVQAVAVQLDKNGVIVGSLQGRNGSVVKSVSELHVSNGAYYMGSYHQNFLARLDMKKLSKP